MTNVARHAHARHAVVSIAADDALELQVRDDGCGIGPHPPGVGLTSMRERAAELGGRLAVEDAAGGGTLVRVWLPPAA